MRACGSSLATKSALVEGKTFAGAARFECADARVLVCGCPAAALLWWDAWGRMLALRLSARAGCFREFDAFRRGTLADALLAD